MAISKERRKNMTAVYARQTLTNLWNTSPTIRHIKNACSAAALGAIASALTNIAVTGSYKKLFRYIPSSLVTWGAGTTLEVLRLTPPGVGFLSSTIASIASANLPSSCLSWGKNTFSRGLELGLIATISVSALSLLGVCSAPRERRVEGLGIGLLAGTTASLGSTVFYVLQQNMQLESKYAAAGVGMLSGLVLRMFPEHLLPGARGRVPLACLAAASQMIFSYNYSLSQAVSLGVIAGIGAQFTALYSPNQQ